MNFFKSISRKVEEYRNPRKWLSSRPILGILVIAALLAFYNVLEIGRRASKLSAEIRYLEEEIARLETEKLSLEREIRGADSKEVIERIAKRELGLQNPGEEVAVIVSSEIATRTTSEVRIPFWKRFFSAIIFWKVD